MAAPQSQPDRRADKKSSKKQIPLSEGRNRIAPFFACLSYALA